MSARTPPGAFDGSAGGAVVGRDDLVKEGQAQLATATGYRDSSAIP
ncbi:MAG: hypothetical protein ACXVX6_07465 [Mycobacterium sp.]